MHHFIFERCSLLLPLYTYFALLFVFTCPSSAQSLFGFDLQHLFLTNNNTQNNPIAAVPTTMKEAIILKGPDVKIVDIPIPKAEKGKIVVKVVYSGSNPKDWVWR